MRRGSRLLGSSSRSSRGPRTTRRQGGRRLGRNSSSSSRPLAVRAVLASRRHNLAAVQRLLWVWRRLARRRTQLAVAALRRRWWAQTQRRYTAPTMRRCDGFCSCKGHDCAAAADRVGVWLLGVSRTDWQAVQGVCGSLVGAPSLASTCRMFPAGRPKFSMMTIWQQQRRGAATASGRQLGRSGGGQGAGPTRRQAFNCVAGLGQLLGRQPRWAVKRRPAGRGARGASKSRASAGAVAEL